MKAVADFDAAAIRPVSPQRRRVGVKTEPFAGPAEVLDGVVPQAEELPVLLGQRLSGRTALRRVRPVTGRPAGTIWSISTSVRTSAAKGSRSMSSAAVVS